LLEKLDLTPFAWTCQVEKILGKPPRCGNNLFISVCDGHGISLVIIQLISAVRASEKEKEERRSKTHRIL